MPREKRDVKELKQRAIHSLVPAIELFNRPHENGRPEGTLILLYHAVEMLLKAIIKDKKGTVHAKSQKYSYGFDKCLEIVQIELKLLSKDERSALSILDAHRDIAVHYYQDVSEDLLYLQSQSAVTLFDDILSKSFGIRLADFISERVLPVSTSPPKAYQYLQEAAEHAGRELFNSLQYAHLASVAHEEERGIPLLPRAVRLLSAWACRKSTSSGYPFAMRTKANGGKNCSQRSRSYRKSDLCSCYE